MQNIFITHKFSNFSLFISISRFAVFSPMCVFVWALAALLLTPSLAMSKKKCELTYELLETCLAKGYITTRLTDCVTSPDKTLTVKEERYCKKSEKQLQKGCKYSACEEEEGTEEPVPRSGVGIIHMHGISEGWEQHSSFKTQIEAATGLPVHLLDAYNWGDSILVPLDQQVGSSAKLLSRLNIADYR